MSTQSIRRTLPALLAILTAACAGRGAPRTVPPDTITPVTEPPVTRPPSRERARLEPGQVHASVEFGRVLPDSEVVALAVRHGVQPYQVWLMVGEAPTMFPVPAGQPAGLALAEARRVNAERAAQWPCALLARLGAIHQSGREPRPAPGDRDPGSRMTLSQIEAARAAPSRLRRGDPAVYGLRVIATAEALRALAADPRVRQVSPQLPSGDVPGPRPPDGWDGTGRRIIPQVEAMDAAEVRRRLDRYTAEGLPECREALRNAVMDEPTVRITPGAVVDGVAFGVRTRVDSIRGEFAGIGPTVVDATITLENRSGGALEVPVLGCTEGMRMYRDSARRVLAVPAAGPGVRCMQDPYTLTLAPGERREVETRLEADRLLSDSVPPGRYYLSATYRLRDRTLEIPAGDVVLRSGLEPLRYPVRLSVDGDSLRVWMNVVNAGRAPVALEYGDCALHVRAYRTADRSGPPAWRSEFAGPYDGGFAYACTAIGHGATLQPGDTLRRPFEVRVPLLEVLGDSLPDGRYWFTATLRLNFGMTPEVPAGDAVIAAPRRPLPSARQSESMRFDAVTSVLGDDVVATVTGTLTSAGGALERFSEACPVVLYAFRTRADRDAAPRAGAPAWTSHRDCPPGQMQHTLNRGESRTWQVHASAREILGDSLPPGRYWFAVGVNHEARRVMLSAGEGVLER